MLFTKKVTIPATVLSLMMFPLVQVSALNNLGEEEKVIVTFKEDTNTDFVTKLSEDDAKEFKNINAVSVTLPEVTAENLKLNPNVLSVEPDAKVKIKTQTANWGLQKIKADQSQASGLTGKGVKIAIIDSGIDINHPDLKVAGGYSTVDYTSSYDDDNGHGTHVAGIIAAQNNDIGTIGIAPDAQIYAVKAMDQDGSGYVSDIIEGIDWAISNHMDVINMSLGTQTDVSSLHNAVDKAYQNGIVVLAAAGNDGSSDGTGDTVDYPAKYDSVIAVGATTESNTRAYFSSTGPKVEISAPGYDILSTMTSDNTIGQEVSECAGATYCHLSGTSMATPFVAGDIALLKEKNPTATNVELRKMLDDSAVDLGAAGRDNLFGYGIIQAPIKDSTQTPEQPIEDPTGPEKDITAPSEVTNIKERHSYNTVNLSWTNPIDKDYDHVNIYKNDVLIGSSKKASSVLEGFETTGSKLSATGNWIKTNLQKKSGLNSLTNKNIGDRQSSYEKFTIDAEADSVLSFDWKVSSEYKYDNFEAYIDGKLVIKKSGETTWSHYTKTLSKGIHTVTFIYKKDIGLSRGYDSAFVDNLKLDSKATSNFDNVKLSADTTYTYTLKTVDINGNESKGITKVVKTNKIPTITYQKVSKSTYSYKERIYSTTKVTDVYGRVLKNVKVTTVLTNSYGTVIASHTDYTNKYGYVSVSFKFPEKTGTYRIKSTAATTIQAPSYSSKIVTVHK